MTEATTDKIVMEGEIVDERNGEIIPKGASDKIVTSNLQIQVNANTIGTLELSDDAVRVLDEKLDPNDVKVRPDGLVYLPWTYWADRLNKAFGRMKWGLVPQGAPQSRETGKDTVLVVWGFWLVVKGVPVGFAMGETTYRTNNNTMSYADAVEGAKSISLARNCKLLGMALELWDGSWVEEWKDKYAKKIKNPRGNYPEYIWVRNDDKRYQTKPESKPAAKPAQKPVAKKESTEVPPSKDAKPVDEEFPPEGFPPDSKTIKQEATGDLSIEQLKLSVNVKEIKAGSGKDIPTIMGVINGLDKSRGYTTDEVISMLNTGEKDG